MNDFGSQIKRAEKEVSTRSKSPQITKLRKDGTPRKRTVPKTAWKKGQCGNPETVWKRGQSANPGGRPQKTPITDAMREMLHQPYTGKEARFKGRTNAQVMALRQFELAVENGDMRAATEITDRVEGKTVQVQQHQGPGGGAISLTSMTPEENEKRIAELLSMAGGSGTTE